MNKPFLYKPQPIEPQVADILKKVAVIVEGECSRVCLGIKNESDGKFSLFYLGQDADGAWRGKFKACGDLDEQHFSRYAETEQLRKVVEKLKFPSTLFNGSVVLHYDMENGGRCAMQINIDGEGNVV